HPPPQKKQKKPPLFLWWGPPPPGRPPPPTAKQSRDIKQELDCFVARAPRNDDLEGRVLLIVVSARL
ncbi:hypothetical protein, partial [Rhodopseudomonas sp. BAL398]|uniref:hypothetical protein n=1 Tax=Rhodopseudomonas sp. BAL398 TaxID=3034676 RepID=UPI0023E2A6D0